MCSLLFIFKQQRERSERGRERYVESDNQSRVIDWYGSPGGTGKRLRVNGWMGECLFDIERALGQSNLEQEALNHLSCVVDNVSAVAYSLENQHIPKSKSMERVSE